MTYIVSFKCVIPTKNVPSGYLSLTFFYYSLCFMALFQEKFGIGCMVYLAGILYNFVKLTIKSRQEIKWVVSTCTKYIYFL